MLRIALYFIATQQFAGFMIALHREQSSLAKNADDGKLREQICVMGSRIKRSGQIDAYLM